jgi:hypothetical protein
MESLGNRFLDVAERMLELAEEKLQNAKAEELSLSRIDSTFKNISSLAVAGEEFVTTALGIGKMMDYYMDKEVRIDD